MVKSQTTRIQEIIRIKQQLNDIGFPSQYDGIKKFNTITNEYVKSGIPWSGKIHFTEYHRYLDVILTTKDHLFCSAVLKTNKN